MKNANDNWRMIRPSSFADAVIFPRQTDSNRPMPIVPSFCAVLLLSCAKCAPALNQIQHSLTSNARIRHRVYLHKDDSREYPIH